MSFCRSSVCPSSESVYSMKRMPASFDLAPSMSAMLAGTIAVTDG